MRRVYSGDRGPLSVARCVMRSPVSRGSMKCSNSNRAPGNHVVDANTAFGSTLTRRKRPAGAPRALLLPFAPTWNGPSRRAHSIAGDQSDHCVTSAYRRHTASLLAAESALCSQLHPTGRHYQRDRGRPTPCHYTANGISGCRRPALIQRDWAGTRRSGRRALTGPPEVVADVPELLVELHAELVRAEPLAVERPLEDPHRQGGASTPWFRAGCHSRPAYRLFYLGSPLVTARIRRWRVEARRALGVAVRPAMRGSLGWPVGAPAGAVAAS
jgi:hypothetical protein